MTDKQSDHWVVFWNYHRWPFDDKRSAQNFWYFWQFGRFPNLQEGLNYPRGGILYRGFKIRQLLQGYMFMATAAPLGGLAPTIEECKRHIDWFQPYLAYWTGEQNVEEYKKLLGK